ncbi:MAG: helix-turn-helix domain-containing protein [Actinomycetota bacterium]|nr:helix-turn-helix domain-containing protein [Actinomycetota bacterium]
MFVVILNVLQRTQYFPTDAYEEAVEAVLRTLRTAVRLAKDLVLVGQTPITELAEVAEEIGVATSALIDRWQRLERRSPYRSASLDEAVMLVTGLMDAADAVGSRANGALSLEGNLSALVAARGRSLLSDRLFAARGAKSLRSLAKEVQLALGYLSDMEAGRAGPPSVEMCHRLEEALGIDLSDVRAAKASADDLKREHRRRTARVRRRSVAGGTLPREDARLRAIAVAAVDDPGLLDLIEAIGALPPSVRRGLQHLVTELARSLGRSDMPTSGR